MSIFFTDTRVPVLRAIILERRELRFTKRRERAIATRSMRVRRIRNAFFILPKVKDCDKKKALLLEKEVLD